MQFTVVHREACQWVCRWIGAGFLDTNRYQPDGAVAFGLFSPHETVLDGTGRTVLIATSAARGVAAVLDHSRRPTCVPFPNTADRSFERQPSVSRFASQSRSGTTPNLRRHPNGDRGPRTPGAPANSLPGSSLSTRVGSGWQRGTSARREAGRVISSNPCADALMRPHPEPVVEARRRPVAGCRGRPLTRAVSWDL